MALQKSPSEETINGVTGSNIIPYQFVHYAISYTQSNRKIRFYKDQVLTRTFDVPAGQGLQQSFNYPLQIMGSLDNGAGTYPEFGSGSAVCFNDFRFYNGTNKNYTGSVIPTPLSIVKLREF